MMETDAEPTKQIVMIQGKTKQVWCVKVIGEDQTKMIINTGTLGLLVV